MDAARPLAAGLGPGFALAPGALASRNGVVVRTLSKAWGLAGLRVGYAIGAAPLIAEIEKSRGPCKVGAVAEAAALAVLSAGAERVRARVAEVRRNRERLAERPAALAAGTWPSAANFLLVAAPRGAATTAAALRERGIAVRPFPSLPGARDCIRVGIGPWPLMQRFLDAWAAKHADDLAGAS